jgi:hypothetical protein
LAFLTNSARHRATLDRRLRHDRPDADSARDAGRLALHVDRDLDDTARAVRSTRHVPRPDHADRRGLPDAEIGLEIRSISAWRGTSEWRRSRSIQGDRFAR